nr:glycosyl hydrolase 53 family protein [Zoogloeaceae bacterium]
METRWSRVLRVVGWYFLFCAQAFAVQTNDDFAGDALDWCRWEALEQAGSVTQDGRLILATTGAGRFGQARVLSQYRLIGDFDVQVDYVRGDGFGAPLVTSGGGFAQLNVAIGLHWNETRFIQFSRTKTSVGEGVSVYSSLPEHSGTGIYSDVRAEEGGLRLVREGSRLSFRHRDGGRWVEVGALVVPATPVSVFLAIAHVDQARGISAHFDDFKLLRGATDQIEFSMPDGFSRREGFQVGGVSENWPAYKYFSVPPESGDSLALLADNGMQWVRVGVTTVSVPELDGVPPEQWATLGFKNHYWGAREYAARTLIDARDRGMRLYAYLYFSDQAANWGNQKAPGGWAGKTLEETATLAEQHAFEVATYFKQRGLDVEIYELGNESDIGMLDFLPGIRIPLSSVDYVNDHGWLRENVWSIQATILKAAVRGIRRAAPGAQVAIHPAGIQVGVGTQFAPSFFKAMRDFGVDYDIAALSNPYAYFPWSLDRYSTACWFKRLTQIVNQSASPGRPAMIVEASYQSDPRGLEAAPMHAFPFSPAGQAGWIRANLDVASANQAMSGFFYFYPELYVGIRPEFEPLFAGGILHSAMVGLPGLAEFNPNLPGSVAAQLPQTGIWVIDQEATGAPGRGFQVDVRNGVMVLTFYGYAADGRGRFWLASGPIGDDGFVGQLTAYDGGIPFGGGRGSADAVGEAGPVHVRFTSATTGIISLPGEVPKAVSRLVFGRGGTGNDITPRRGVWVVESESNGAPGRGFQVDHQGEMMIVTFYGYDDDGAGNFWLASGPYSANAFAAPLVAYIGGTPFGSEYRPARGDAEAGAISLEFINERRAILRLPGEDPKHAVLFKF